MADPGKTFTADDARVFGEEIGIDWATSPFDVDQFRVGMNLELEHGLHDPRTKRHERRPARHRQNRPRSPERVPRLLHTPGTNGRRGEARVGRAIRQQTHLVNRRDRKQASAVGLLE